MSKALAWIRKSRGSDDDIGLEEQRELVLELAHEVAEEVVCLDLGVHTGFSTMSRKDDSGLLDQNPDVLDVIDRLEQGEFDYLVAFDDRRICRDNYLTIIQYSCNQGDAEIVYVGDVADDDLTFDIHRRIERETKEEEIRKAKRALERRREKGYDEGRPRWGTKYDSENAYLVPDPDQFPDALLAIRMAESKSPRFSYRDIIEQTEINSTGTLKNILDSREWYHKLAEEHDIQWPSIESCVSRVQ
ncbi:serine integrase family protein [Natronobacterium haloterrestre]|uniref:recombinase family protein n=1 Tax=Natronobacterium haloterrestre TaxID=148448 RepID=UPI000B7FB999|nr:recombinase family protein [Halobiforma haloterrestris]